jgi:site-specific DNA-methyltransferase (adenine-specific)
VTRWAVHHVADSFAKLKELPDECVDVVLTDPPYNEHVQSNMSSGTAMKRQVDGGKGGGIPRIELPFEALSGYEFAVDLVRVAKRWAISFCAVEDFALFKFAVGASNYIRSGIWHKPNSMGQLTGDRPATCYEGLAIMHRAGKKQWNGRGSYGLWKCNGTRGEKGRHPNQKPLKLCLELVSKFTNRGETVLDPFAGSGRIGEACIMLGRNYVGFERDEEWLSKARERLSKTTPEVVKDEDCMRLCAASGEENK